MGARHAGVEAAAAFAVGRAAGPRWRQVQAEIENDIENGVFAPRIRLPSEDELAQRFQVHRHTVRRAIARLREKQILRVEQGRGTFVREPDISYKVGRNTRLSVTASRNDKSAQWRIRSRERVGANRAQSIGLALPLNHPLQQVCLLRVIDDRIIAMTTKYFPLPRFQGIDEILAETGSVTAAMRSYGIEEFPRKSTSVRAVMPSADEARVLQISRRTPLLELTHINVDKSGIPVQLVHSRHNAELINFLFEF